MAKTKDEIAEQMRQAGVSEGVIADEAGYLADKYADPDEDVDAVLRDSLGTLMQRSKSGGDRSSGGYSTDENDPAIGNAPARTDSARLRPEPSSPYSGGASAYSAGTGSSGSGQLDQLISQLMANNAQQMEWATADRTAKQSYNEKVRGNLIAELEKAKAPVTESDPIIAKQIQVGDFNNQRGMQQAQERMAARESSGGGMTSGARDAALQSGMENLTIAKNSLTSKLMADEVDKRRAQATSLLGTQAGVLSGDEAVMAQRDMAQLNQLVQTLRNRSDATIANRGLDIEHELGLGGLELGRSGLDLQRLAEGNRNTQFYDDMAYRGGHDAAMLNYLYAQLAGAA